MDLSVRGQKLTTTLRAPGIIKAQFSTMGSLISFLEIELTSDKLFQSMIEQARLVVFKIVARGENPNPQRSVSLRGVKKSELSKDNSVQKIPPSNTIAVNESTRNETEGIKKSTPSEQIAKKK